MLHQESGQGHGRRHSIVYNRKPPICQCWNLLRRGYKGLVWERAGDCVLLEELLCGYEVNKGKKFKMNRELLFLTTSAAIEPLTYFPWWHIYVSETAFSLIFL